MTTGIATLEAAASRSYQPTVDRGSQRKEPKMRKAIGVILTVAMLSVTVQAASAAPAEAATTPRAKVTCSPTAMDPLYSAFAAIAIYIVDVDQLVVWTYARVHRWDKTLSGWKDMGYRDYQTASRGMDIFKNRWTQKGSWYWVEVWVWYDGASQWFKMPQVIHETAFEYSNRTDVCHL